MHTTSRDTPPTLVVLGRTWASIGLQSFGGGASTQLLIRRAFVERNPWIGVEELAHFWNLCQFTPGINLIALTILIGRKLGGPWGIMISLAGMLLPSAALTCFLTAGFEVVQHSTVLHAILRGVIPATAGIMAVVMIQFARPLLQHSQDVSGRVIVLSGVIMVVSAAGLVLVKLPVVVVLVGVSLLGVVLFTPWRTPVSSTDVPDLPRDDQI